MQSVYKVSEPTSRELSAWSQSFIRFPNLPPGDSRQGVQPDFSCSDPTLRGLYAGVHPVFTVSKPTSRGLSTGGIGYS